jgi:formylglycine-generating enzyme required for sulfatase activity
VKLPLPSHLDTPADIHDIEQPATLPAAAQLATRETIHDIDAAVASARAPTGMAFIPGQSFVMGSTPQEAEDAYKECTESAHDCKREEVERERSPRVVTVSSFYLDKKEVTNRSFAEFLNFPWLQAKQVGDRDVIVKDKIQILDLHREYSGIEYHDGKFRPRPGFEELPIVQVTWQGARRYCQSRGYDALGNGTAAL